MPYTSCTWGSKCAEETLGLKLLKKKKEKKKLGWRVNLFTYLQNDILWQYGTFVLF